MFVPILARYILMLALTLLVVNPARAEIIYDNSDLGTAPPPIIYSPYQYGDQVHLAGTSRILTQLLFMYYGDFTATSGRTARLRIYLNDGPKTAQGYPTPGTVIYTSDSFALEAEYETKSISGLNIVVPDSFTWTVEFDGFAGTPGDEAGLLFLNPPTVGTSGDGAWQLQNGTWSLFSYGGNPVANFVVRIVGADPTFLTVRLDKSSPDHKIKAIFEWPGLSILQRADSAAGPYQDLEGPRNRYTIQDVGSLPLKFYRLRD